MTPWRSIFEKIDFLTILGVFWTYPPGNVRYGLMGRNPAYMNVLDAYMNVLGAYMNVLGAYTNVLGAYTNVLG